MNTTTGMVDVGGHQLRLALSGSGETTFLCLHGLVDRIEIWDRIAEPLSNRGRVARLDQRGHGESEAPTGPYRREDLAADVSAVIRELGNERVVLVGHSMGGIMSMATALLHPDQIGGLVLIGTASQCNEKTARWYERIARAGEEDGNAGLVRAIYGDKSKKVIHGDARGIAEVTRTLGSLYEDPLTPKLSSIECPVLLIVGDKDPMGSKASSIIAGQFPSAELVTIPDCGHWVHVDEPEAVLEAIDRFLPRLES
jgi:pimeloyl-ACP methyl ester carboxylesterase